MLLVFMLAVAGIISTVEFIRLSNSVHGLIEDNYKSIEATKSMLEALEREDSGVLLLMLGEWEEGRKIISSADSAFLAAFKIAQNNLTETNEKQYIDAIQQSYSEYKVHWQRPIVDTDKQGNIAWYKNDTHQLFINTKNAVNELMNLNQTSMYNEASSLKEKSKRAIMPGLVSIVAAVVFSLILSFFITKFFVAPISELAKAVGSHKPGEIELNSNIQSNDEIKQLENAINELIKKTAMKTPSNYE